MNSLLLIALLLFALLPSCRPKQEQPGGGKGGFATNIITEPVVEGQLLETINVVGTLQANERVDIKSEIEGVISEIKFEEGDEVSARQELFVLNAEKLLAKVAETEANFTLAQSNINRYRTLLDERTISQQNYDEALNRYQAEQASLALRKEELEDTRIVAPFGGVIGKREVSPGQFIESNQKLATLIDITPIKADFEVPERFLKELQIGQKIVLSVSAYSDEKFQGEVYFISPEVSPLNRTVLIRAKLANEDGRLKPGMFGSLKLVLKVKEKAIIIPEIALIRQADATFVMVVTKENIVEMRPVEVGSFQEGKIELLSGVEPGEEVITEGHQKVGPGSTVNLLSKDKK